MFGNSMLFDKSNQLWADKRKSLSAAFYKEKMNIMLKQIVKQTSELTKSLLDKYADQPDKHCNLSREISDLVMKCIQLCVFGQINQD